MFQIQEFLQQLHTRLICLRFSDIVTNLQQIYRFKPRIHDILPLCKNKEIDNIAIGCYKGVIIKLINGLIQEKEEWALKAQQKNILLKCKKTLEQSSKQNQLFTKYSFQRLVQTMSDKIWKKIEFIFFLIQISSGPVLLSLSKNSKAISSAIGDKILRQEAQIPVWACIIINYYTTGLKISGQVFSTLKRKYLFANFGEKIQYIKQNKINFLLLDPSIQKFKKKNHDLYRNISTKVIRVKDIQRDSKQQLKDDLTKIFSRQKTDQKTNDAQNQIIKNFDKEGERLLHSKQNIKSNLKSQRKRRNYKRENIQLLLKPNNLQKQNQFGIKFGSKSSRHNKPLKKIEKSYQDMILQAFSLISRITASQKNKQNRENDQQDPQNVEIWIKKIKNIKNATNIQKISYQTIQKTLGKKEANLSLQDNENESIFQQLREQRLIREQERTFRKTNIQHEKNISSKFQKGFSEYIDAREPSQMKIIKDVVNYKNYSPQRKHKKYYSRKIVREYNQFMNNMNNFKVNFQDQSSYNYRLQMVLSGCSNKL